jgi:hypothetical protein
MREFLDHLPPTQQLELAIRTKSPAYLARVFAAHAGQFYDRADFDNLARQARDLYAVDSADRATVFRARLDRRFYDRYHASVAWDVTSSVQNKELSPRVA